jgi:hypothetical protein
MWFMQVARWKTPADTHICCRGLNLVAQQLLQLCRLANGGMFGAKSEKGMAINSTYRCSQEFDDSFFFQRLTLIDICCGPPALA